MIKKYDKVKLKLLKEKHLEYGFNNDVFGDVIDVYDGVAKILFYNPSNFGDFIVCEQSIDNLILLNRPKSDKYIKFLDEVFLKVSENKGKKFHVNKFKEYDCVELIADKNIYKKYGLKKGSRGCVVANYAVGGKILVEFFGGNDLFLDECMGVISVDLEDLKLV